MKTTEERTNKIILLKGINLLLKHPEPLDPPPVGFRITPKVLLFTVGLIAVSVMLFSCTSTLTPSFR